jgi:hypothetical protein
MRQNSRRLEKTLTSESGVHEEIKGGLTSMIVC